MNTYSSDSLHCSKYELTIILIQIDESGAGLLNRGVLLIPVKNIPKEFKKEEQKEKNQKEDTTNGFLAVVDTVRYTVSFVPLQKPFSNTR